MEKALRIANDHDSRKLSVRHHQAKFLGIPGNIKHRGPLERPARWHPGREILTAGAGCIESLLPIRRLEIPMPVAVDQV